MSDKRRFDADSSAYLDLAELLRDTVDGLLRKEFTTHEYGPTRGVFVGFFCERVNDRVVVKRARMLFSEPKLDITPPGVHTVTFETPDE